ncbi:MAG: DUF4080 domain-containing protein [Clostridiales bacterium]|nr:DUF4080 domain-containing protein [Clostridiales bacterium]
MVKTLILAINAKYIHSALAPWYLKAAVRAYNKAPDGSGEGGHGSSDSDGSGGCGSSDSGGFGGLAGSFCVSTAGPASAIPEPEILETNINRPYEEILDGIVSVGPDILAVSCYIWNISLVGRLLDGVSRRLPDCVVILGGPEVSYNAAERLESLPMADYVVCGEGEGPFVRLLADLCREGGAPPAAYAGPEGGGAHEATVRQRESRRLHSCLAAIPGLAWRLEGKVVLNPVTDAPTPPAPPTMPPEPTAPPTPPSAPTEPPDPYLPEYMAGLAGRIAYLETSRGCPFSCGFCLSGRSETIRFFDMERAKRDLVKLANTGSKTVKLVDRTFNCHPGRAGEIIRFLLESRASGAVPPSVCFHFEVAADLFDRATVDLLRGAPAGLFQLEIGLQSFQARTLEAVGRSTDFDRFRENFLLLREMNNIHLHLDLIAGLPGEDEATFRDSFDQAFGLAPHMLQLGFLKLLHGSRLREQSEGYGIVYDTRPPYRVRRTSSIGEEGLATLALCEDALSRLYNSGRFPTTLGYLLALENLSLGSRPKDTGDASPCAFFTAVGSFIGSSAGMPLESYISEVMRFGESRLGADHETLRDSLVIDWLQTNHVGVLPLCLQRKDPLSAKVERALERGYKNAPAAPALGTRRPYGFGLLYSGRSRVALADYRQARPHLGNYPLRIVEAEELLQASR